MNMQLDSRAIRDNLIASSQELREHTRPLQPSGQKGFCPSDKYYMFQGLGYQCTSSKNDENTSLPGLHPTSIQCNSLHMRPWIGLGHFQACCHFLHCVPGNPGMKFQWREPTFQEYKVACNIQINSYSAMALPKRPSEVESCTNSALLAPCY